MNLPCIVPFSVGSETKRYGQIIIRKIISSLTYYHRVFVPKTKTKTNERFNIKFTPLKNQVDYKYELLIYIHCYILTKSYRQFYLAPKPCHYLNIGSLFFFFFGLEV